VISSSSASLVLISAFGCRSFARSVMAAQLRTRSRGALSPQAKAKIGSEFLPHGEVQMVSTPASGPISGHTGKNFARLAAVVPRQCRTCSAMKPRRHQLCYDITHADGAPMMTVISQVTRPTSAVR
jgi:hypothetical protein